MYMADMNRSNLYIIRIMAQLTQITIWIDDKKILNSMKFFFWIHTNVPFEHVTSGKQRDATTIKRRLVFCVRNALRIAKVNVFFSFWRFSCSFAYSLITFDFLSTSNQISHDPRQYVEPFLNVMMCEIEKKYIRLYLYVRYQCRASR